MVHGLGVGRGWPPSATGRFSWGLLSSGKILMVLCLLWRARGPGWASELFSSRNKAFFLRSGVLLEVNCFSEDRCVSYVSGSLMTIRGADGCRGMSSSSILAILGAEALFSVIKSTGAKNSACDTVDAESVYLSSHSRKKIRVSLSNILS